MDPDLLLEARENSEKPFKEIRKERVASSRKVVAMKLFLPLWIAFVWGGFGYLAWKFSRQAFEDENSYTIKHYEFNDNMTQVGWKTALFVWLIINTLRPQVSLKGCGCFLGVIVWFILGCIRSCALGLFLYDVPYRFGIAIYQAWALNWTNYWKSVDEPFITNASSFNAGLCWWFSCLLMGYITPVLAIYGCLIVVFILVIPIAIIKGKFGKAGFKAAFGAPVKFLLMICWDIKFEDVFSNVVKTRVVLNDSKEAQAKRDAFYKK